MDDTIFYIAQFLPKKLGPKLMMKTLYKSIRNLITFVGLMFILWSGLRIFFAKNVDLSDLTWEQPEEIKYDGPTYVLKILNEYSNFNLLILRNEPKFQIAISKKNSPHYGYVTDQGIEMAIYGQEVDYIKKSKVVWTQLGVTFIDSNHKSLFIPKESFVGGR